VDEIFAKLLTDGDRANQFGSISRLIDAAMLAALALEPVKMSVILRKLRGPFDAQIEHGRGKIGQAEIDDERLPASEIRPLKRHQYDQMAHIGGERISPRKTSAGLRNALDIAPWPTASMKISGSRKAIA
jgi:hypothetical protein